jgi:hypothetical protein
VLRCLGETGLPPRMPAIGACHQWCAASCFLILWTEIETIAVQAINKISAGHTPNTTSASEAAPNRIAKINSPIGTAKEPAPSDVRGSVA